MTLGETIRGGADGVPCKTEGDVPLVIVDANRSCSGLTIGGTEDNVEFDKVRGSDGGTPD